MNINSQLNLNRKQIASVKRTFANNKTTYAKMAKVRTKIEKLAAEYKELETLTQAWEAPVKAMTKTACGVALTSEEVLNFLRHPESIGDLERQSEGNTAPANEAGNAAPFEN